MLRLEELKSESLVRGVRPGQQVKIVSVAPVGEDAVTLYYKDESGTLMERMLFRSDEPTLELVQDGMPWSFTAHGDAFKLGVEAMRIQLAHLFDPMMAVHCSDIQPLPHQITAVYESMLPRQPLRFVLADDPGAGKTIMAGLLIREMMMRGDVVRCLIVSPGSLTEQWQDELGEKFGLDFTLFGRELVESSRSGNPFNDHNQLICRLDQLSRSEDLRAKLKSAQGWDLIIVDEAHKLSANWFGAKLNKTDRFELGELLGIVSRHFLLMTATPHNGKEEDFQTWLSLIDSDRFYGKFRDGVHKVDISDLMRRMVKEELLTFEGKKLFPERIATTVDYKLSDGEAALYTAVTDYVRTEMDKADKLDGKRKGTVGFALTALQRRLASSPEAILRSLQRRHEKLGRAVEEARQSQRAAASSMGTIIDFNAKLGPVTNDDLDDTPNSEAEDAEEELVDQATAAQTIAQLESEIAILSELVAQARVVRLSGHDRKWEELRALLMDTPEMFKADGKRRKILIFTEHRDTLNYLRERITDLLGTPEAILSIHGGTKREDRKKAQELFWNHAEAVVLLATDAAGEGVNLQVANLMVNYDLPWNPNRIEQRFGRIHRIGQRDVCFCWNLVAMATREGDVFHKLFTKLEAARLALGGRVFDILGEVFEEKSLKDLLVESIRYGNDPERRANLERIVDGALDAEHLRQLMRRNALTNDVMTKEVLFRVKEDLEKAEARRLQPFYIRSFFLEAFTHLGGEARAREAGRWELRYVPGTICERGRILGVGAPITPKYNRVCFDKDKIHMEGKDPATFIHPGHPLMRSSIDIIQEAYRGKLREGCLLVNRNDDGCEPKLLLILEHGISDASKGEKRLVSQRVHFLTITSSGQVSNAGFAPHLDCDPLPEDAKPLIAPLLSDAWIKQNWDNTALAYAAKNLIPEHLSEVVTRRHEAVDRQIGAVRERLVKEINYWNHRAIELQQDIAAGRKPRRTPEESRRIAQDLTTRLNTRLTELEAARAIASNTPKIIGGALIIPAGYLLAAQTGSASPAMFTTNALARTVIEKAAIEAVMAKERAMGHVPEDVGRLKLGWDITSRTPAGDVYFIEVKGRMMGAETITVTRNEILYALNQPDRFILAVCLVAGTAIDGPHYIRRPFQREPDFGVTSVNYQLGELLALKGRT